MNDLIRAGALLTNKDEAEDDLMGDDIEEEGNFKDEEEDDGMDAEMDQWQ